MVKLDFQQPLLRSSEIILIVYLVLRKHFVLLSVLKTVVVLNIFVILINFVSFFLHDSLLSSKEPIFYMIDDNVTNIFKANLWFFTTMVVQFIQVQFFLFLCILHTFAICF